MSKRTNIILLAITVLVVCTTFAYLSNKSTSSETNRQNYIQHLEQEAEQGNPKAYHLIALEYQKGKIVQQDYKKAREWLQKGADSGFANAQMDLGKYYYHGWGGDQDLEKAYQWYQKAEEQKDITTLHNLGLYYFYGEDIERDYGKAKELFLLVTHSPEFESDRYKTEIRQTTGLLGYMYLKGLGTDPDLTEARKWLKIAADKGNKSAKKALLELEENK